MAQGLTELREIIGTVVTAVDADAAQTLQGSNAGIQAELDKIVP